MTSPSPILQSAFYIPIQRTALIAFERGREMNPTHILVVDDEKNQRDILQLILSGERDQTGAPLYDVKTASSGQEALRLFKHERFDLVMTDLKMAGMDGIQL